MIDEDDVGAAFVSLSCLEGDGCTLSGHDPANPEEGPKRFFDTRPGRSGIRHLWTGPAGYVHQWPYPPPAIFCGEVDVP